MIDATEQLKVNAKTGNLKEAEQLFYQGSINGVFLIPRNFGRDILDRKQTRVVVYCDASRFFVYKQVLTGASFSTGYFSEGIEYRKLLSRGKMPEQAIKQTDPLQVQTFNLYNPSSGYATFIIPGILLIVIQQSLLVGIGLLIGKQYERRKNELIPTPDSPYGHIVPTILGKAFVYGFLYFFTSLFLLGCLYKWLSFPDRGSFMSIYVILIPYIFVDCICRTISQFPLQEKGECPDVHCFSFLRRCSSSAGFPGPSSPCPGWSVCLLIFFPVHP